MQRSAKQAAPKRAAKPTSSVTTYHGPGGLLPWQGAVLAGVLGIFALAHPVPAALSLLCLWTGWWLLGGRAKAGWGMAAAFLLGLGLAWFHLPEKPALPEVVGSGQQVRIQGVVDEVTAKPDQRLTVLLREVTCTGDGGDVVHIPGRVSWSWHVPSERIHPGRTVQLTTTIDPVRGFGNPGAWDFEFARRMQEVHSRIYSRASKGGLELGPDNASAAQRWRARLVGTIESVGPTQGGAMLTALLTGDRFGLEPETIELVRSAGLSHTLALSGLHLGFVVALGVALAWAATLVRPSIMLRLPRPQLAVLTATPLVLGYVWLGGFAPSLVRASLMFAFMAFFLLQGRGRVVQDGLFFALVVILLCDPLAVLDIRLQLSVTAVLGIGLFLPMLLNPLQTLPFMRHRTIRWGIGILAVSLCATMAILPVTARTFGLFAPNLLLNLFWLPLLGGVVMPLGVAGLLLSFVSEAAASGCFHLAVQVLDAMLGGLEYVAQLGVLPLVQLLRPLWPELLGAALLLACLGASMRVQIQRERGLWVAVLLGAALMVVPHVQVMAEDASKLELAAIDVGQGQSLLITVPGGRRTIIDGGGLRSRTFDAGRDVVAPYLTNGRPPRLERVMLTHPHADHYKGLLHLLRFFEVESFVHGGDLPGGSYRKPFLKSLGDRPRLSGQAGDVVDLGQGVRLVTVHPAAGYEPKTTNDISLIQRLEYDGRGLALVCGDAENHALEALLATEADLRSQVLVLPHHGSKTSWLPSFYARVRPEIALCSSGSRNRFIQPHPPIVEELKRFGCPVWSTHSNGMLRVRWNGPGFEKSSFLPVK